MNSDNVSTTDESTDRKSTKPVMEKRRRARINASLTELKYLLSDVIKREGVRHSRMEKADILEMAVRHLRDTQQPSSATGTWTALTDSDRRRLGFMECTQEVSRYLDTIDDCDVELRTRILEHLTNRTAEPDSSPSGLLCPSPRSHTASSIPTVSESREPTWLLPLQTSPDANNNTRCNVPFTGGTHVVSSSVLSGLHVIPAQLPSGEIALLLPAASTSVQGLLPTIHPTNIKTQPTSTVTLATGVRPCTVSMATEVTSSTTTLKPIPISETTGSTPQIVSIATHVQPSTVSMLAEMKPNTDLKAEVTSRTTPALPYLSHETTTGASKPPPSRSPEFPLIPTTSSLTLRSMTHCSQYTANIKREDGASTSGNSVETYQANSTKPCAVSQVFDPLHVGVPSNGQRDSLNRYPLGGRFEVRHRRLWSDVSHDFGCNEYYSIPRKLHIVSSNGINSKGHDVSPVKSEDRCQLNQSVDSECNRTSESASDTEACCALETAPHEHRESRDNIRIDRQENDSQHNQCPSEPIWRPW